MAGPFQPYGPELARLRSSNSASPLSPSPVDGKSISFKPNVNRAKTKRWVEAKKYSYDGNDWGDDDYDEYDDETPPVPDAPTVNTTQAIASASNAAGNRLDSSADLTASPAQTVPALSLPKHPGAPHTMSSDRDFSAPTKDRSRSLDQVGSADDEARGARSLSADAEPSRGGFDDKPLPFIRPADIYRRMQEERARQQLPSQPGQPSTESPSTSPQDKPDQEALETPTQTASPNPSLPELERVSSLSADLLFGSTRAATQSPSDAEAQQEHSLQHNPSLGFRSVVHQAFDVPETPSSTVDSVGRSNSDSTSVISPIIAHRGFNEDKTPTIMEEPGESGGSHGDAPIGFKLGHRRDMSLPSPDNSPSKQPVITDTEPVPQSELAEVSSVAPAHGSDDHTYDPQSAVDGPAGSGFLQEGDRPRYDDGPQDGAAPSVPEKDLPPPLRLNSSMSPSPEATAHEVPVIMPAMSTETSPQDTENDRLRKEIIRSLSRENSPSYEPEPPAGYDHNAHTNQYERYLNDQPRLTSSNVEQPRPTVPETTQSPKILTPDQTEAYRKDVLPPAPVEETVSRPKLERRFSWESTTSEESEATPPPGLQSQGLPAQAASSEINPATSVTRDVTETETSALTAAGGTSDRSSTSEKPQLTILPPMAENDLVADRQPNAYPEVVQHEAGQSPPSLEDNHPTALAPSQGQLSSSTPPQSEPVILGFRDIIGIRSSPERVRAFDRTRAQFATLDTGLDNWIRLTIEARPEHTGVVEESQKLLAVAHRPSPNRAKFPKLPSLHNFASHQEGLTSGPGHARRTSAPLGVMMNRQQVEQRGKDLLHTAGVLGGKAGEAAKGLFAKGKSRFRSSEKDSSSTAGPRRSLQLSGPASSSAIDSDGSYGKSRLPKSLQFGSLPLLKRPRTDDSLRWPSSYDMVDHESPVSASGDQDEKKTDRNVKETRLLEDGIKSQAAASEHVHGSKVPEDQRQQSSSASDAIHHPDTGSFLPNDDDYSPYTLDFEQEVVAALRLADVDVFSDIVEEPAEAERNDKPSTDTSRPLHSSTKEGQSESRGTRPSTHGNHEQYDGGNDQIPRLSFENDAPKPLDHEREARSPSGLVSSEGSRLGYLQVQTNSNAPSEAEDVSGKDDSSRKGNETVHESLGTTHVSPEGSLLDSQPTPPSAAVSETESRVDTSDNIPRDGPVNGERLHESSSPQTSISSPSTARYYQSAHRQGSSASGRLDRQTEARGPHPPLRHSSEQWTPRKNLIPSASLHQIPSISSLGTQSTVTGHRRHYSHPLRAGDQFGAQPSGLQSGESMNGGPLGQTSNTQVSLPSEPSDTNPRSPMSAQRPVGDAPSSNQGSGSVSALSRSARGNDSPLRNETAHSAGTRNSFFGTLSPANSDIQSVDSTRVNAATSGTNLALQIAQAEAAAAQEQVPRKSTSAMSAMNKLKKVGKLHRMSLGNYDPGAKDGGRKRALGKITGLFSRQTPAQQTTTEPTSAPAGMRQRTISQPASFQPAYEHVQPPYFTGPHNSGLNPNYHAHQANPSFSGRPPPPQGYYAPLPQVPQPPPQRAFIGGHRLAEHREAEQIAAEKQREAGVGVQGAMNPPVVHSQPRAPTQPNTPPQASMPVYSSVPPRTPPKTDLIPSRGRTYIQNLHLRSRSPTSFSPRPEEKNIPSSDASDPAYHLGTFQSIPRTSRSGDQERPWNITLPAQLNRKPSSPGPTGLRKPSSGRPPANENKQLPSLPMQPRSFTPRHIKPVQQPLHRAPPTSEITSRKPIVKTHTPASHAPSTSRATTHQDVPSISIANGDSRSVSEAGHPHRGDARVINTTLSPVELPVTADDSSEEIVMTSTAYPGQEWRPSGFSHWDHY